jgi:putative transcriptional regulator
MSPSGNARDLENRVREIRSERGLTQNELAQAVGLTRQSIISIEKGRFTPSIHTALNLAAALETSVDDLFWITDENEIEDKK